MSETSGLSLSMIIYFLLLIIVIDFLLILVGINNFYTYKQSLDRYIMTDNYNETGEIATASYEILMEDDTKVTYTLKEGINLILLDTFLGSPNGITIEKEFMVYKVN